MGFAEEFFQTLQTYNETVLPMILVTYALGVVAVLLTGKKTKHSSKAVSAFLSFLWLWSGCAFFILFFGPVNTELLGLTLPGVWYAAGILFVIQAILIALFGVAKPSLSFSFSGDTKSIVGAIAILYAMVIYPLVGLATGLGFPRYPVFGVAPCPVTIFTCGLLLMTDKKIPSILIVVPFVWSIMGIMPVLVLNVYADIGLLLTGITATTLILRHKTTVRKQ